jgi:riboflavin kinase
MVMSIGYNPFYKNTVRSAEVHILHKFPADFYGAHMRLLLLGFIRKELDYTTLEALVEDINFDCEVAKNSLRREGWAPAKGVIVDGEVDGKLDVAWLTRPLETSS